MKNEFESPIQQTDIGVIEQAKQQLERMIDLNPQIMLLVDRDCTILRANKALLDLQRTFCAWATWRG